MNKMQILLVVRPATGGIRTHIKAMVTYLAAEFDFTIACPSERMADYHALPCHVRGVPLTGCIDPVADLRTMRELAQIVQAGSFQMIHAHGFKAAFVARPVARFCKIPCLVTLHSDFAQAQSSRLPEFYVVMERILARWTTEYITVSQWLAKKLVRSLQISEKHISVIPNGIEMTAKHVATPVMLPFAGDLLVVGTVARLVSQKGLDVFLHATALLAPRFPHVRFVVAGEGPLRSSLEQLRETLGLTERVIFLGYCEHVAALLATLSVFVMPSVSEAQGIAVLEAMVAGCPVVVSATGGLSELVQDNYNGLLVAPSDDKSLAKAIEALLVQPQLAARLAKQAQLDVTRFSQRKSMGDTKRIYQRVLEGGPL
ncbi:MAG: glycosyltransferase family 4 protein [Firmicutes bacterium]|nr:glycosyltransferase family 4 protein [Bacillota bacterium]